MRISCRPFPTTERISTEVKYDAQVVIHRSWSQATFYHSQNIPGFTNEKLMDRKRNQQHLSSWVLLLSSAFSSPDGDWMKSSSHLGILFVFLPAEVTLNSANNYLIIVGLLFILLWVYSPVWFTAVTAKHSRIYQGVDDRQHNIARCKRWILRQI